MPPADDREFWRLSASAASLATLTKSSPTTTTSSL
jgi:hypothetical protein